MARPIERQVADWLLELGKLVAGSMPIAEVRSRLNAYVPELVARYPSEAFDGRSREIVARGCKFFPSYGELCDLLDAVPPAVRPVIAGPQHDGLDETDRAWMVFWHKRRAEIWAQDGGFRWRSRDAELANLASLVRQQSPLAWAKIDPSSVVIQDRPSDSQIAALTRALRMPGAPLTGRPMPEQGPKPRAAHPPAEQLRAMREARGIKPQENHP